MRINNNPDKRRGMERLIKYRTGKWRTYIEKIEIERETDASVWVDGRRFGKKTSYDSFFDTWKDAHEFLLRNAERTVVSLERRLEYANERISEIKALVP